MYGVLFSNVSNGKILDTTLSCIVQTLFDTYGVGLINSSHILVSNCAFVWNGIHMTSGTTDCIVTSSEIYLANYGVYIENSDNNTISDCNIYDCGDGIFIEGNNNFADHCYIRNCSTGVEISLGNSNVIGFCNIINNEFCGVYILSQSRGNEIHFNNFINNTVNAQDDGSGNNWDMNHWSDYKGQDANGDDIGDTPYNILGTANAKDNMPKIQIIPEFTLLTLTITFATATTLTIIHKRNSKRISSVETI